MCVQTTESELRIQLQNREGRLRKRDQQRRAMIHVMGDLKESNERLAAQRKAMIHILVDHEKDRRQLASQATRIDNSRRALLHLLQDAHRDALRLEGVRKAVIHIMGDLKKATVEMSRREQDLRDKQEQLVQAGKLATLGELATGIAHELNNPLNNIGLFVGNATDLLKLGVDSREMVGSALHNALKQVRKAGDIISHLRTFGRAAPVTHEPLSLRSIIDQALSLVQQQFGLRQIAITVDHGTKDSVVMGNSIQLEQVFLNLLTNARDAVTDSPRKEIHISSVVSQGTVKIIFTDTGCGIPRGIEDRIFDPFFTTKEVGKGTGLGLSITHGIIKDHGGTISVVNRPSEGTTFLISLPLAVGPVGTPQAA